MRGFRSHIVITHFPQVLPRVSLISWLLLSGAQLHLSTYSGGVGGGGGGRADLAAYSTCVICHARKSFLMWDNCHVSVCEWKAMASPAKNWFHIERMGKTTFPLHDLCYTHFLPRSVVLFIQSGPCGNLAYPRVVILVFLGYRHDTGQLRLIRIEYQFVWFMLVKRGMDGGRILL